MQSPDYSIAGHKCPDQFVKHILTQNQCIVPLCNYRPSHRRTTDPPYQGQHNQPGPGHTLQQKVYQDVEDFLRR